MSKQAVIVLGATGNTGESITRALLDDAKFDVRIAVRPSSLSKPLVKEFEAKGAKTYAVDTDKATALELAEIFKGVDTVVSCLLTLPFTNQKVLVDASKLVNVKRFIPSEWATVCKRGALAVVGIQKAEVRDYIKEVGVPYTIIDVGWWMHIILPHLDPSKNDGTGSLLGKWLSTIVGTGDVKGAFTALGDVGKFVARIIADPRTLNRYVFVWGQELTQNEIVDIARRVSGHEFVLKHKSVEDVEAEEKASSEDEYFLARVIRSYVWNLWVLGDNVVERAKLEEYGSALDARELYPDVEVTSLETVAKTFYADQK